MEFWSISLIVFEELSSNSFILTILFSSPNAKFSNEFVVFINFFSRNLSLDFNVLKLLGLASNEIIFLISKFVQNKSMVSPWCAPISINKSNLLTSSLFFINFNIFEGDKYTISDAEVVGDIPLEDEIYSAIIESLENVTFSQAQITSIEEFFESLLGNRGYAFAEVSGSPEIQENSNKVKIIFTILPGKRTYTRKILVTGNNITQDHVLRREMRQFEGAWSSNNSI